MKTLLTSEQLIAQTGITARQLQWWDEMGIVVADRNGRCRVYNSQEKEIVSMILILRKSGFSLQRIRKLLGRIGR